MTEFLNGYSDSQCVAAMLATNSEYIALFPRFLPSILWSLTCAKPGLRSVLPWGGGLWELLTSCFTLTYPKTTSYIYALALWMLYPPTKMHARPWLPPLNFTCLIRPNASYIYILCLTMVKCSSNTVSSSTLWLYPVSVATCFGQWWPYVTVDFANTWLGQKVIP